MENTMLAVALLGIHVPGVDVPGVDVSGIDVSAECDWQRKRPFFLALDAFPTVNGIGVSAGGRRT